MAFSVITPSASRAWTVWFDGFTDWEAIFQTRRAGGNPSAESAAAFVMGLLPRNRSMQRRASRPVVIFIARHPHVLQVFMNDSPCVVPSFLTRHADIDAVLF